MSRRKSTSLLWRRRRTSRAKREGECRRRWTGRAKEEVQPVDKEEDTPVGPEEESKLCQGGG